jgi:hypothetical protein
VTIDQHARNAARAALESAEELPLVPLSTIDQTRRRRSWTAAALGLGSVVVAIVLAVAVSGPEEVPVATDPTTVVSTEPTTVPSTVPTTVPPSAATTEAPRETSATTVPGTLPDSVGLVSPIPAAGVDADVVLYDYSEVRPVADGTIGSPLGAARFGGAFEGQRTIAADGQGGFVTLFDATSLLWWRAGAEQPIQIGVRLDADGATLGSLIEVVSVDGSAAAIVRYVPGEAADVSCEELPLLATVSLETGQELAGVSGSWAFPPGWGCTADPATITLGDSVVTLETPDWEDVARDPETGQPVPPIPVTDLVVSGPQGERRIPLTTDERPFAALHDFDGRRVLVSIEPWEPALPPRLFTMIDLECEDCTVSFESLGFASGALIRPNGEALHTCAPSAGDLVVATQPGLDDGTATLSQQILEATAACDLAELERLTPEATFIVNHAVGGEIGWEAALEAQPALLSDVIRSFSLLPDRVDGTWRWPGFAFRQWDELPADQRDSARNGLDATFTQLAGPGMVFEDWFDDSGNGMELGTVAITYDPTADAWRFEYWLS